MPLDPVTTATYSVLMFVILGVFYFVLKSKKD